jgi:hypothetical protein
MARQVLRRENVFIDESPIPMLESGKGKTHTTYMWVLVGGKSADPPYRIYNFRTNRQHHNALELLSGYQKVLHSDKFSAYEALASWKQFIWYPCFAHIRRNFFEAESGWSRLDNNVAERAVRPLAIGFKNWLFVGNEDGGEAAAIIFSLVQTCRGLKINSREYLDDIMRRLMSHPINKLFELLPDQWFKSKVSS